MNEYDDEYDDLLEDGDEEKKPKRFKRERTDKDKEYQDRHREWQRSQKKRK